MEYLEVSKRLWLQLKKSTTDNYDNIMDMCFKNEQ